MEKKKTLSRKSNMHNWKDPHIIGRASHIINVKINKWHVYTLYKLSIVLVTEMFNARCCHFLNH